MTPINDVFMLSIDSKLDYEILRRICATGRSRVPVYEEVAIKARNGLRPAATTLPNLDEKGGDGETIIVKRVIGILLAKQVGNLVAD